MIRCREAQSNVLYPTEVDDELFGDGGFQTFPPTSPIASARTPTSVSSLNQTFSWLRGWNFTTDLYRVLEHAVDHFRGRRPRPETVSFVQNIFGDSGASQSSVLNDVMIMYANMPQRFKETPPVTFDQAEDRYSFQAANIAATIQVRLSICPTDCHNGWLKETLARPHGSICSSWCDDRTKMPSRQRTPPWIWESARGLLTGNQLASGKSRMLSVREGAMPITLLHSSTIWPESVQS